MSLSSVKEYGFFLVKELQLQIQTLSQHDHVSSLSLRTRHDYIENLVSSIQNRCIESLSNASLEHEQLYFRCFYNMGASLGELSFACMHASSEMNDDIEAAFTELIASSPMRKLFARASQALYVIEEVINDEAEPGAGQRLCEIAQNLNQKNGKILKQLSKLTEDKFSGSPKSLLLMSGLLFRLYMDLCNIIMKLGEVTLSLEHNDILNLRQFRSLQQSLASINKSNHSQEAALERLAETKSGCMISGVQIDDQDAYVGVLKEGPIHKLRPEREKMLFWQKEFPGYVPDILTYDEHGDSAALLIEYIDGRTYDQALEHSSDKKFSKASQLLLGSVEKLWTGTLSHEQPAQARFMNQLSSRLDKVFLIHKEFNALGSQADLQELILACTQIEATLVPKFSVLSHGDFNMDNVLFSRDLKQVKFIDLHRSRYSDYLQDASVFMLSNVRFLAKHPEAAERVNQVCPRVLDLVRTFAAKNGDRLVESRLALGLARSFISSTRFIYDDEFAESLYRRGMMLLKMIANQPLTKLDQFEIPTDILYAEHS